MTGKINDKRRGWTMTLTGAGLALATAGCMTTDPYGGDPYANDPYANDQAPYDQGYGNQGYGNQGDYDPYRAPANGGYAAPYGAAPAVAPRRIRGDIAARDFPRNGAQQRNGRSAVYHLDIGVDGRVTGCRANESSGLPDLDAFMCRLLTSRFFYEPARDANGRPVSGVAGWQQSWNLPGR